MTPAEKMKAWRLANPEESKARSLRNYYNRKEKAKAEMKRWKSNNRAKCNAYSSAKRKSDPSFKISEMMRVKLRRILIGRDSAKSTLFFFCDRDALRSWIESQFQPSMTWDNRGYYGWHVDHVIPCTDFDQTDLTQRQACWNFKNLRPMWRADNQHKNKSTPAGYSAQEYTLEFCHAWATNRKVITPKQAFGF